MKIKTSQLSGIQLDYAVTMSDAPDALEYGVEDWRVRRAQSTKHGEYVHRYHQSDMQAGPILRAARICRWIGHDGVWMASYRQNYEDSDEFVMAGRTDLEAGLRCYVRIYLGDEVDIPEELT